MQTIITRRIGMTDTKPTRYSATASGGLRVVISEPMECQNDIEPHIAAIRALRERKDFAPGRMVAGTLADGGLVWVFVDKNDGSIEV